MGKSTRIERLLRLLARLPLPLLHAAGGFIGWVAGLLPNRHLHITLRNLELCFPEMPEPDRRRLARESLVEAGKTVSETLVVWFGNTVRIRRLLMKSSGEEIVRKAFQQGKGIIFVSPHLGSWEYLGLYLGTQYPMTTLFRPPRKASLGSLMQQARERMGAHVVPTDAGGVRALYQALGRGEAVGILPDQDPREKGVFAPFFGVPANTMTLLQRLARKTGAPVIFSFAERLPNGTGFHLHFLPAPEAVYDADPLIAATAVNQGVEACVRSVSTQYQWNYKRFRTRPEGEKKLY